jgi:2'-5' RNA ligase
MPHITLIYPFRPVTEFDKLGEQFESICEDFEPFELELANFNLFQHSHQNCTVWLATEPDEQVIKLQTLLWEVVPDCNEVRKFTKGFTPHLSVGQARGRDIAKRFISDFQAGWASVKFTVSDICLIWRNDPPDDAFRVDRNIQLGK